MQIKIAVSDVLQMQRQQAGHWQRFRVKVLAVQSGQSISITTPLEQGMPINIQEGDRLQFRYLADNQVLGFHGLVEGVAITPNAVLTIAYPERVEHLAIRNAVRVSADLEIAVFNRTQAGNGDFEHAQLRDISSRGAGVWAHHQWAVTDDVVELDMALHYGGLRENIRVQGVVRNVRTPAQSTAVGDIREYGIEFRDLDQFDLLFLQGYIHEQVINGRSK